LAEFLFGIQIVPRAQSNKTEWERIQSNFAYYNLSKVIAEEAVDLQLLMRRRGRQVALIDALIAAIALRNELTLLTTDHDFEPIPYLQQENWIGS